MLDKFLEKTSTRERIGLLVAIFSLIIVAADRVVVQSIRRGVTRMEQEIASQKKNHVYNAAVIAQGVPSGYDEILAVLGRTVSPEEAAGTLKDEVLELARKSGIDLPSTEERDSVKTPSCDEYSIEVSKFEVSMASLLKFLDALETSPDMLRATRLNLTAGREPKQVTGSILITKLMVRMSASVAADETAAETPE